MGATRRASSERMPGTLALAGLRTPRPNDGAAGSGAVEQAGGAASEEAGGRCEAGSSSSSSVSRKRLF